MILQTAIPIIRASRQGSTWGSIFILLVACCLAIPFAYSAETVHLFIRSNGELIQG